MNLGFPLTDDVQPLQHGIPEYQEYSRDERAVAQEQGVLQVHEMQIPVEGHCSNEQPLSKRQTKVSLR